MAERVITSNEHLVHSITHTLRTHNIPLDTWGQGKAKTLGDLVEEIQKGEAVLETGIHGELLRRIEVVGVDVFHKSKRGQVLKLIEDKQIFTDGRERRRVLDTSLSEKMKQGELPTDTAKRAIEEELNIRSEDLEKSPIYKFDSRLITKLSDSYPGITLIGQKHFFNTFISEDIFNANGYVENQPSKKTYFVWQRVPDGQVEMGKLNL